MDDPILAQFDVGPLKHMELREFYRLVKAQVGTNVASFDQVKWVHAHNPQSLLVIRGRNQPKESQTRILGLVALLFLTEAGEKAVREGYFTSRELKGEWLATDGETHRAIYTWAIAANGQLGRYKLARLVHFLSLDVFGGLDQYGFAATEAGQFFLMKLGFQAAHRFFPQVRVGTFFKPGTSPSETASKLQ